MTPGIDRPGQVCANRPVRFGESGETAIPKISFTSIQDGSCKAAFFFITDLFQEDPALIGLLGDLRRRA